MTNGALGELTGYDLSPEGRMKKLYVKFYDEKIEKRGEKDFQTYRKGIQMGKPPK